MILKIGERRLRKEVLISYIAVIYVLLFSGSVIQYANLSLFGNLNSAVTTIVLVLYLLKIRYRKHFFQKNIRDMFVLLAAIGLLISFLIWGEFDYIIGYYNTFCMVLLPCLICKNVNKKYFFDAFLKVIFFLALSSVVLYKFPMLLSILPIKWTIFTSRWDFDFYLIYAKFHEITYEIWDRNIGIFWEPGMYQGFIIFAMFYYTLNKKFDVKALIYQLVMLITLFTIQSSTGFILMIPIIFIIVLENSPRHWRKVQILLTIVIILSVLVVIYDPSILYSIFDVIQPGLANKIQIRNDGGSMGTRFYSAIIDAVLAIRHPFGISPFQVDQYRAHTAALRGYIVDGSNINTTFTMMLYYGLVPGTLYLIMLIKGCFKVSCNIATCIMATFILLMIINTEPHYMTLFFTVVLMYFAPDELAYRKRV